jgi:signal transduction histidine kinase
LIDFCNPAIQDLFEFSADQLLGQNLNDLLRMSKKQCTDLLSGGQTIECEIDRGDTQIRVEATAREIPILEQRRCLVMVANVTKRHELQRLKRQFLAMIAHDLRSPLTAISGTLELIARKFYDPDTEHGQAGIRSASMNIDRMLRLISDLLEMEKFDATNLSLDIAKVNIRSIIDEALDSVRGTAEHSQVSLQKHLIDTELDADKLRMVQVLVNLLSNAIKYSPPNSTVSVNGRPEGRWVVVEVTDSGPGISEADQEMIFEPYKQAKVQAGERSMEGTGLGLTICKSLVEAHRGRIGVVNAEPSGSTFWIRIPIKQSDMSWRV